MDPEYPDINNNQELDSSNPSNNLATAPNIPVQQGADQTTPDLIQEAETDKKNILRDRIKSIVSTVLILLAAPVVALALTAFVFQSYEVDGPSMERTLQNHDRLIVSKVERNLDRFNKKPYIPERGDVIIFTLHASSLSGSEKQLVKRVVGLPGDRVTIHDGFVTIYNKNNASGFYPDDNPIYKDKIESTDGNVDVTVPANELYVMGDNRSNSLDSRAFGTIASKDIVGKLILRIFPFNKIQKF